MTNPPARKPPADPARHMPFLAHLAELRRRIIISLLVIVATSVVCWIFYGWIVDLLIEPYCSVVSPDADGLALTGTETLIGDNNCKLLSTDPLEPLSVRFSVALYGGIALAIPILLWQLWRFIVPALRPAERRYTIFFVVSGVLLFAAGAALAYWSIPRALDFLIQVGGDDFINVFSPRRYLSFIIKMMLAFGLGFEFPVLLIFTQMIGLISTKTLRQNRRYCILGIVVLVAVITPSGDPITLAVLSVPLYIFYELSILYGWRRNKRLERSERSERSAKI